MNIISLGLGTSLLLTLGFGIGEAVAQHIGIARPADRAAFRAGLSDAAATARVESSAAVVSNIVELPGAET